MPAATCTTLLPHHHLALPPRTLHYPATLPPASPACGVLPPFSLPHFSPATACCWILPGLLGAVVVRVSGPAPSPAAPRACLRRVAATRLPHFLPTCLGVLCFAHAFPYSSLWFGSLSAGFLTPNTWVCCCLVAPILYHLCHHLAFLPFGFLLYLRLPHAATACRTTACQHLAPPPAATLLPYHPMTTFHKHTHLGSTDFTGPGSLLLTYLSFTLPGLLTDFTF